MLIKRARGRIDPTAGKSGDALPFDLRVAGDRILEVGEGLEPTSGEAGLDLAGAFLTPGLVDVHVHLELGSDDAVGATLASGTLAVRSLGAAAPAEGRGMASSPVTSRAPGCDVLPQSPPAIPKPLLVRNAGRALAPPRGYGGFLGRRLAPGERLREAVLREAEQGADLIKVIVSGAVDFASGAAEGPYFTREDLAEAVRAARDCGLSLAAHANGPASVRLAVEAGVDSVEHGIGLGEAELALLAERQVAWVPTLTPLYLLERHAEAASGLDGVFRQHLTAVARGRELGATILAGTDAGSPAVPHGSLGIELDLLGRAGFAPDELARLATEGAGRLLGIEWCCGLRPGAAAILAWFATDPFQTSPRHPGSRQALGVVCGERPVYHRDG